MFVASGLSSPPEHTVALSAASFTDSVDSRTLTVAGRTVIRCNALASVRMRTSAGVANLIVYAASNVVNTVECSLPIFVDGVYAAALTPTVNDALASQSVVLNGQPHLVEVVTSWQQYGTAGTYPVAATAVGGTVEVLSNPTVERRLVVIGDSIANGASADLTARHGWIGLLRTTFAGRIALLGWGGAGITGWLGYDSAADLATVAVALVAGASRREVWYEMGYNDWHGGGVFATYVAALGALYDAIHAADPTIKIWAQTPLLTGNEAAVNAADKTIADYRTAQETVAATRPWVTVVPGPGLLEEGHLSDGVHPNTDGHVLIATAAGVVLGP